MILWGLVCVPVFCLPNIASASNAEQESAELQNTKQKDEKQAENNDKLLTITASRQTTALREIASSIAVIDNKTLDLIGHVHINQALARVPGTWISRGNGQEHLTAIRSPVLTGAGACGAFFMAEDGISLRAPGFCNVNQLFDANTEQAEQLEIVRGPGSVLYGSNAVHGTINIISPDLFNQPSNYLGLDSGSFDYQRAQLRLSHAEQQQAFGVYGNFTHDGGYQADSGFEQQKLNMIHQYRSDDFSVKSMLSLANINQETAGFIRGKDTFKDELLRRSNPNPEAFRDSQSWRAYSRFNWILSETSPKTSSKTSLTRTSLSITPYVRYTDMTFIQHFVPWKPIEENSHNSVGIKSVYSVEKDSINWHVGIDWESTRGKLREEQLVDFSPTIPLGTHYDYQVEATSISPFADFRWTVATDFVFEAGVRYDHILYDYDNRLADGSACEVGIINCRFIRPEDQTRRFNHWSPRLSFMYFPTKQTTLYGELTQGFRAPHTSELFRLQAGQQNADLKTERLSSFQIGLRGHLGKLGYDLGLYQMEKQNFIFRDSDRQVTSNGETKHKGIELAIRYPFSEHWQFSLAATHAKHQYENNIFISSSNIQGNEIDTAPKQMANAKINWAVSRNTNWELEWVHLGEYYLNPENTASYPGHDLINLRGKVTLGKQTEISLKLINLTNKDYAERADFGFGDYRYFVGQPRTLFLGIRYQLFPNDMDSF